MSDDWRTPTDRPAPAAPPTEPKPPERPRRSSEEEISTWTGVPADAATRPRFQAFKPEYAMAVCALAGAALAIAAVATRPGPGETVTPAEPRPIVARLTLAADDQRSMREVCAESGVSQRLCELSARCASAEPANAESRRHIQLILRSPQDRCPTGRDLEKQD